MALLIQSGDLQAAGIASAYGSRAGAVGPQCLKLRLHLVACRAIQRPERRTGAMQRSCESSLRTIFRSGRLPSEGAENTRAFLAALREKCSTEIGAMTGLLLALFEERVDASKAGYELAQKLKRGGGGAAPREELDMEMLFGDTKDFESAASVEVKTEQVDWTPELEAKWRAQVKGVLKLITHMVVSNTNPKIRDSLSVEL